MLTTNRLKIAIQKKGRLHTESIDLLSRCGLTINNHSSALLYHCQDLPIDVLFVRDDDIATLICNQICDIGIVGENVVYEQFPWHQPNAEAHLDIVKPLGFGYCQLALAGPKEVDIALPDGLQHKRIATSYPNLLTRYLNTHSIDATIVPLSGSVEIAPRLAIADFICDLVSTGQTLEANHLCVITTLFSSQAILIKSKQNFPTEKQGIFELLLRRIEGVLEAKSRKYILFHAPHTALAAITELLPGTETPTVLPLSGHPDKVAVHVVSAEAVFWDTLEKLKQVGASSILVLPIEKMLA